MAHSTPRFWLRVLSAVLPLALCGCSMLDMVGSSSPAAETAEGPEPAYRQVASREIKAILGDPEKVGLLQISPPHVVDAIKGRAWLTCLKSDPYAQPHYHAVFIQDGTMVDSRVAVVLDRCEQQEYAAFDWVAEAKRAEH